MIQNTDRVGLMICTREDDPRITRVRRRFRKRSLDELPQLFKILKGYMSLVVLGATLAYQGDEYKPPSGRRLLVRPETSGRT